MSKTPPHWEKMNRHALLLMHDIEKSLEDGTAGIEEITEQAIRAHGDDCLCRDFTFRVVYRQSKKEQSSTA